MKNNIKSIVVSTIQAICISVIAVISLVLILDILAIPIFAEFLLDSSRRDWCGIFSRCASWERQTFIEYIWSGDLWVGLNIARMEDRLKWAVLGGVIMGVALMGASIFSNRRK